MRAIFYPTICVVVITAVVAVSCVSFCCKMLQQVVVKYCWEVVVHVGLHAFCGLLAMEGAVMAVGGVVMAGGVELEVVAVDARRLGCVAVFCLSSL